ncbi:uncharacterized protein [Physcomitrium patens]|uniref:Uncharacterized protein n=1 Tax=Physcomitrium patens TaxID=3218 RepID=A0A2K1IYJ2_PHYPA|nr:uncharacterized protein LOC112272637 isoform X1 [Physcomitrium patens]PNR34353.1 hypothetical protein PHYPA_024170 [Physcomitrium patens]|eukprot:XP_024356365.1 uncharacterized protein LOC112272637 isoform X1 [Physcomitrella patens]
MAMMIKVFEASSDHSQQLLRKLLGSFEILGWRIWVDAGVEGLGTRGLLEHFQVVAPTTWLDWRGARKKRTSEEIQVSVVSFYVSTVTSLSDQNWVLSVDLATLAACWCGCGLSQQSRLYMVDT